MRENNCDWSEYENKASELYDSSQKENSSCPVRGDLEDVDSLWLEDANSRYLTMIFLLMVFFYKNSNQNKFSLILVLNGSMLEKLYHVTHSFSYVIIKG